VVRRSDDHRNPWRPSQETAERSFGLPRQADLSEEFAGLISQFAIASISMLSGVLHSSRAIAANVEMYVSGKPMTVERAHVTRALRATCRAASHSAIGARI
jgi:hypothetical protein